MKKIILFAMLITLNAKFAFAQATACNAAKVDKLYNILDSKVKAYDVFTPEDVENILKKSFDKVGIAQDALLSDAKTVDPKNCDAIIDSLNYIDNFAKTSCTIKIMDNIFEDIDKMQSSYSSITEVYVDGVLNGVYAKYKIDPSAYPNESPKGVIANNYCVAAVEALNIVKANAK